MNLRPRKKNDVVKIELTQDWYTLQQVADLLGCTKGNLSAMYTRGNFMEPDKRVSNTLMYSKETFAKWLVTYRPNNDKRRIGYKPKYEQLHLLEDSKE